MMIAAVKAFARKDELNDETKKEDFKKQFQLDKNIDELKNCCEDEGIKELVNKYFLTYEDAEEFTNDFKASREEALEEQLKKKFKENLPEDKRCGISLKDEGGRKAFMNKYKIDDIDKIDTDIINKIEEQAKTPLKETDCLVVALMSHGDADTIQGNIYSYLLNPCI